MATELETCQHGGVSDVHAHHCPLKQLHPRQGSEVSDCMRQYIADFGHCSHAKVSLERLVASTGLGVWYDQQRGIVATLVAYHLLFESRQHDACWSIFNCQCWKASCIARLSRQKLQCLYR